jgi:hypothetical protein
LQSDKEGSGKEKNKTWDKMVPLLKSEFFPVGYALNLLRRLQNLK